MVGNAEAHLLHRAGGAIVPVFHLGSFTFLGTQGGWRVLWCVGELADAIVFLLLVGMGYMDEDVVLGFSSVRTLGMGGASISERMEFGLTIFQPCRRGVFGLITVLWSSVAYGAVQAEWPFLMRVRRNESAT